MKRFSAARSAAIDKVKYMGIRSGDHRSIWVWVVVIDGRVCVRSWNDKASGWYRAFLEEPRGAILLAKGKREIPVRAVRVRSAKLNEAVDRAYAEKYTTKSNEKYVKGFAIAKRRGNTLELRPI